MCTFEDVSFSKGNSYRYVLHVFKHICTISHVATILARVIVVITCGVIHVQNTWSHVTEVCDYKY